MSQPIHTPEKKSQSNAQPKSRQEVFLRRFSVLISLAFSCALLLLFTGHSVYTFARPLLHKTSPSSAQTATVTPLNRNSPLSPAVAPTQANGPLLLPDNHQLIYQQADAIYMVPMVNQPQGKKATPIIPPRPVAINTPGYVYNRSVQPILTPAGQLIYTGDGIWQTSTSNGHPQQIAPLAKGEIITSLVMSSDTTTLAWSTAPLNGQGTISIYVSHNNSAPQQVYQQTAATCPCFRVFSFANQANDTLLLTDDRGDHGTVEYGLWKLTINQTSGTPVAILPAQDRQGPLAIQPQSNALLYSSKEMLPPFPSNRALPNELAAQAYPNSLLMAQLDLAKNTLNTPQEILPPQPEQSDISNYRWAATPTFSPDGHTLVYVLFASDNFEPYGRHNALYVVPTDNQQKGAQPQLLATASSSFIELGPWLSNTMLTFYADNWLYALDTTTGMTVTIAPTSAYARIIGMA